MATTRWDAAIGALIGRDAELRHLAALLEDARRGTSRLVTVVGEPGIGKTRLLREFADRAAADGASILWGSATEFEQQTVFGVFLDATVDVPPGADRFRVHRATTAWLEDLACTDTVVLVLDDLHWADDGSIELCKHLLRHPPRARLVVAAAYRPRQVPTALAVTLAEAVRHGALDRVDVGPLTFADVVTMFPDELGERERKHLYEASEGNPLYLDALSRGSDGSQPLQAALAAEVAALRDVPRLVAHSAAVVGDAFEPDITAAVAELSVPVVLDAIEELVRRDLMRTERRDGRLRFRHPLIRNVAYHSAGPGWRLAAHARAAVALRRRGAPLADQAHHVERYAGRGDNQSLSLLAEAGTAALHTAPAVAAHWFLAVLRLLPEPGVAPQPQRRASAVTRRAGAPSGAPRPGPDADPAEPSRRPRVDSTDEFRLETLGRLARALALSGRLRDSREVLHEVLTRLPVSTQERAHVANFCAMVDRLLGHFDEANALLRAELYDLADQEDAIAAIIKLGLAFGEMLRGEFGAGRDWTAEARQTALALGDRALHASALTVRGLAVLMGVPIGRYEEAVHCIDEAASIVDGLTDQRLVEHIDSIAVLGSAELLLERYPEAERHLQRVLRVSRDTGKVHLLTNVTLSVGTVYLRTGRLDEAMAYLNDALEWALLTGSDEQRTMAQSSRCWILAWTGELEEALRVAEEAVASAGTTPTYFAALAHARLAQVRYYSGDLDGARSVLLSGCGGPELLALDAASRLRAELTLAAVEAGLGDNDAAYSWADRAEQDALRSPAPSSVGVARLARAEALRHADPAAAASAADEAAHTFLAVKDPVLAGRALLLAGRGLAATQHTAEARDRFARARRLFEGSGARLFLAGTAREERRMNARISRPSTDLLTRREREIVGLVRTGLTSRQIAEHLHLSTRTVESHVARVFVKLDVTTRTALIHMLNSLPG